ncbi:hypothetical protein POTOM_055400 [Populus tomentosa]|uniref:Uncharacterized protein n=1 Tax=Populus tomentosa TaxID=118781 RepID=A0A8X8C437_POPTO|nr:hypothetical protein POTOM_055400 [Populus tomentosa]
MSIAISRCLPQATRKLRRRNPKKESWTCKSACVQLLLANCHVQPKDEAWSMIVTVTEVKGGSFVTVIEVVVDRIEFHLVDMDKMSHTISSMVAKMPCQRTYLCVDTSLTQPISLPFLKAFQLPSMSCPTTICSNGQSKPHLLERV